MLGRRRYRFWTQPTITQEYHMTRASRASLPWRLFYTLRYHHPSQLWRRLKKRSWDRVFRPRIVSPPADCQIRAGQQALFQSLLVRRLAGRRESVRQDPAAIDQGIFRFLGVEARGARREALGEGGESEGGQGGGELGSPKFLADSATAEPPGEGSDPDPRASRLAPRASGSPRASQLDHLWYFHLHYHEFLFDLVTTSDRDVVSPAAREADHEPSSRLAPRASRLWTHVQGWIDDYPTPTSSNVNDAWHPFCISRRIPVWMMLWHCVPPNAISFGGNREPNALASGDIREDVGPVNPRLAPSAHEVELDPRLAPSAHEGDAAERETLGELRDPILASVYSQADYLHRNLELDLGGNHLLENLRALVLAAVFLDTRAADDWLATAEHYLRRELPVQCLDSGEHFERAPAYHAIVVELLLEIRDATSSIRPGLSEFVAPYVESMQRFLASLCHPDGEIPLFSDSALGSGPVAAALKARGARREALGEGGDGGVAQGAFEAERPRSATESATAKTPKEGSDPNPRASRLAPRASCLGGYWIWRQGDDALIFDRGQAAVDSLPAHAHCDLLNLEASVGGERVIVDGGVFDYGDTEMRRYCRSTKAHNVLEVDGMDQFDVWSRFRMGYRGHVIQRSSGTEQGCSWAKGSHNAYRRLGVPVVDRLLRCYGPGSTMDELLDQHELGKSWAWVCSDTAKANAEHHYANRVKIHPAFEVERVTDLKFRLTSDRQTVWLEWKCDAGTVEVEEGWYCPEFGERHRVPVVTWRYTGVECRSDWVLWAPAARV